MPLELGGAPRDPKNLWPVLWDRARADDYWETRLHTELCAGEITLAQARAKITVVKRSIEPVPPPKSKKPAPSPVAKSTPRPAVVVSPDPVPTVKRPRVTPTTPPSVYYANCAAVKAAHKAPLYAGQPGYRLGLDRDHNGVACQS